MKDFMIDALVLAIILFGAIGGFLLVLICNPLFWFAVMTFILAVKL